MSFPESVLGIVDLVAYARCRHTSGAKDALLVQSLHVWHAILLGTGYRPQIGYHSFITVANENSTVIPQPYLSHEECHAACSVISKNTRRERLLCPQSNVLGEAFLAHAEREIYATWGMLQLWFPKLLYLIAMSAPPSLIFSSPNSPRSKFLPKG